LRTGEKNMANRHTGTGVRRGLMMPRTTNRVSMHARRSCQRDLPMRGVTGVLSGRRRPRFGFVLSVEKTATNLVAVSVLSHAIGTSILNFA